MTVEIKSRSGWLYAVVRRQRGGGKAVVRRLGTRSMTEARELIKLANLEQIALAAKADAIGRDVWTRLLAGRKMRVRDAVTAYEAHRHLIGNSEQTIVREGYVIDHWLRFSSLANASVGEIEAEHVAAFVNEPGDRKLASREFRLAAVRGFLSYVAAQRWIIRNPALDIAVRLEGLTQEQLVSTPRVAFTEDEVKKLLAAVPRDNFWHGAILIGYHYGLRIGAVATLEETNVANGRLRIFTTKGRRMVDEPMEPDVAQWLSEWRKVRPASGLPFLFPRQGSMVPGRLSEEFTALVRRHGITGKSFHGLRKTAANRKWNETLAELGDEKAQILAAYVTKNGYAALQKLLAHAPGSDVTANHYMERSP